MSDNQIFKLIFGVLLLLFFSQSGYAQVENAYVTNFSAGTVSVISTATNSVLQKLPVGEEPIGIAVNSSCRFAYVANFGSNGISIIDLNRNSVSTTPIPGLFSPSDVVISPDNTTLYVDGGNNIFVLDASSLLIIATIPVPGSPQSIAITPDGAKLFVSLTTDYSVIDTATNTIIETVPFPFPFDEQVFTISPDGQTAYLTERLVSVSGTAGLIISTTTNQIINTMPPTPGNVAALNLAFVPNTTKAYLSGGNTTGNDLMQIYDPGTNTFTGSFFVGTRASDMAFTQDASRAYVTRGCFASMDAAGVAVVDTAADLLVDNIDLPLSDCPIRIAMCTPQPTDVPTISEWGALIMVGVFALAAVVFLRRRATI